MKHEYTEADKLLTQWGKWLCDIYLPGPSGYPSSDMVQRAVFGGRWTPDGAVNDALYMAVDNAVGALPPKYRHYLHQYYANHLEPSLREMAAREGLHHSTVEYRLERARAVFWVLWEPIKKSRAA